MSAAELCTCRRCFDERWEAAGRPLLFPGPHISGWAYACHLCGNKRCPHHANHRFRCTASNEADQVGVLIKDGEEEGAITPIIAPSPFS